MSARATICGLTIEKSEDNKKIFVIRSTGEKSKPINVVGTPEHFGELLYKKAISRKLIEETAKKEDFVKGFLSFLEGVKEEPSLITFEETPTPVTAPSKPVEVPFVSAPITKFMPEKEKPVEKEPKAIDGTKLVARYQELSSANLTHETIIPILEKEFNIPAVTIQTILPPPSKELPKPAPTAVAPSTIPTPPSKPEEIELPPEVGTLQKIQLDWLTDLSKKVYRTSEKQLILRYMQGAKKRSIPTHWLNLLFEDAIQHGLVRTKKEKVRYMMLWCPTGDKDNPYEAFDFVAKPNITVAMNHCYKAPEYNKIGRLIALSRAVGMDNFPEKPVVTILEDIGDLPDIPSAYKAYVPMPLDQILAKVRKEGTVMEAMSGTVIDINPWSSGEGCFICIHDGSNMPNIYATKVMLNYENDFGLTEDVVMESRGKMALVYGSINYRAATDRFPEGMTVFPMFIIIGT